LAEVTEKYDKIRKASQSRLGESAAPTAGKPAAPKGSEQVNTRPGDALDAIARQIMEQRAQAQTGA